MPQDFHDLIVWRRAHELTVAIYRATQRLPRRDYSALVSQLRRAAASIPANIAEGCGREGNRELARFLQIAMASATELEYHLILAGDLSAMSSTLVVSLRRETVEIKRMLTVLIQRVRATPPRTNH